MIYVGSFSKVLIPTLRLGYLILPQKLLAAFHRLNWFSTQQPSVIDQLALALLINTGQLLRHIAKMNNVYRKRRNQLVFALTSQFENSVEILNPPVGLHVTARFKQLTFSPQVLDQILQYGVRLDSVQQHTIHKAEKKYWDQVVLGFANLNETQIVEGVCRLKAALNQISSQ